MLIIASDRSAARRAAAEGRRRRQRRPGDYRPGEGGRRDDRLRRCRRCHRGSFADPAGGRLEDGGTTGQVLLFAGLPKTQSGVELDTNLIHYKELLVTGTTASTLSDCQQAVTVMEQQLPNLDWLITEVFALAQARQAVDRARDRSSLKVVMRPDRP